MDERKSPLLVVFHIIEASDITVEEVQKVLWIFFREVDLLLFLTFAFDGATAGITRMTWLISINVVVLVHCSVGGLSTGFHLVLELFGFEYV